MSYRARTPWKALDPLRGKYFKSVWPTIPEMLDIICDKHAARPAFQTFIPHEINLTWSEVGLMVRRAATGLASMGVKKGDVVAISGANSPEWAIAFLSVLYCGATVSPLDRSLQPNEIDNLTSFCSVKVFLADTAILGKWNPANKAGVKTISLDSPKSGKVAPYILDWLGAFEPHCLSREVSEEVAISASDTAAILFTSGTTGKPKGVMLSHSNFMSDAFLSQSQLLIEKEDVFYAVLPLHHAYTLMSAFLVPLTQGAKIAFGKRLIAQEMFKEMKASGTTIFLSVPMFYNKIAQSVEKGISAKFFLTRFFIRALLGVSHFAKSVFGWHLGKLFFGRLLDKFAFRRVKCAISGGGPLAPSTSRILGDLGIDFLQGYGLTETSPIIALNPKEAFVLASVGRCLPAVDYKIEDPDSSGNGIIKVRGPMVMQGYFKNSEKTREVLDDNGWFNTGDLGSIKKGYLFLSGRQKNIIVTDGGKNVYPEELEDCFQLENYIDQIMIDGYTENKALGGERIRAIIHPSDTLKQEKNGDKPAIKNALEVIVEKVNRTLASYKKITKVEVSEDELPVNSSKKIKREEVRKKFPREAG